MKKKILTLVVLSLSFAAVYGQQTETKTERTTGVPPVSSTFSTPATLSALPTPMVIPSQIIYVYTGCPCMHAGAGNAHFMQTFPSGPGGAGVNLQFAAPLMGVPAIEGMMISPAGPGLYQVVPVKEQDKKGSRKKAE